MRHGILCLALAGLAWGVVGCNCGDGGGAAPSPTAAPSGAKLPGPDDAGIDVPNKKGTAKP